MAVINIDCDSLDSFWSKLQPDGDLFNSLKKPVFRGQGEAEWELTPLFLRFKLKNRISVGSGCDGLNGDIEEYLLLSNYLKRLDEAGLSVPGESAEVRECFSSRSLIRIALKREEVSGYENFIWPPKLAYPLIASAQHHGVPTRFLDVTSNPIVASYFAAVQALQLKVKPDYLSVWVFDVETLDHGVEYVSVPGSSSRNLAVQRGGFLFKHYYSPGLIPPPPGDLRVIDSLHEIISKSEKITAYKVNLSGEHAVSLLRRCDRYGFCAATLFPGYDGAAKSAIESLIRNWE